MTESDAARRAHDLGIDPLLLDILACPSDDHAPVVPDPAGESFLVCTSCGKRFPVVDGIPVMLLDEAT